MGCFDECCHDVKQQQFVDLELLSACVSINRSINSSELALFCTPSPERVQKSFFLCPWIIAKKKA
jgi:hypothetical protein